MLYAPSLRHLMSGNCMMKTLFLFVLILWHDVLTSTKESRNWSSKKKKSWSRLTDKGFVLKKPRFLSKEQFTLPNSKWNTVLILTWILSLSVSTAIIPGGPGLAGTRIFPVWILLELRVLEVVVKTGAIRCSSLQSKCHHQQTNTQLFTGRMPFLSPNQQCQSTEGRPNLDKNGYASVISNWQYLNPDSVNSK